MKIQIVKFENGKFGARIKYLFNRDEYLDSSSPCEHQFPENKNIMKYCVFDNEDDARMAAHKYIEWYKSNKKKLNVEVIDEINF